MFCCCVDVKLNDLQVQIKLPELRTTRTPEETSGRSPQHELMSQFGFVSWNISLHAAPPDWTGSSAVLPSLSRSSDSQSDLRSRLTSLEDWNRELCLTPSIFASVLTNFQKMLHPHRRCFTVCGGWSCWFVSQLVFLLQRVGRVIQMFPSLTTVCFLSSPSSGQS